MKPTLRLIVTIGMVALAVAFVACGGSSSSDTTAEGDDAAHVEGDEHEDTEAEANAYLELAPKDALFLVEMTSFAFEPNVMEVKAGDVLEIAIQNVDPILHDFTIDEIGADVHISYLGGSGEHAHEDPQREADVHFALTEPGSGVVHVRAFEPGEYVFYCSVPGHREAGMEGTLIVTAPEGGSTPDEEPTHEEGDEHEDDEHTD